MDIKQLNKLSNRKPASLIPAVDKKRLEKLYQYEILNTPAEEEFDKIAHLAANIFDCPAAFITFVDVDTVFFKSNLSTLNQSDVPRKDSLCSLAILDDEVTMIEDASRFDDLMESPYVCNPGGIRFYAGAPLITPEGYRLGTICVIDEKPRTATKKQLNILVELSGMIIDKLESRLINKKVIAIQAEYMNRSVHDLKNYIGNLLLATDMLMEVEVDESFKQLSDIINRNAYRLSDRINQILNLSKIESNAYNLSVEKCNISALLDEVVSNYSIMSNSKNQIVIKRYAANIFIDADCKTMSEIFENILNNAIKYSFLNSEIVITSEKDGESTVFGFHDKGQGLTAEDMEKMFTRYAKLSSTPTGRESSTGMGLTITKILVELHHGRIWAESMGKDQGCSFFISFPRFQ